MKVPTYTIQSVWCMALTFAASSGADGMQPGPSASVGGESPAAFSTTHTGDIHDFEYLIGAWTLSKGA
jgi:hypothetical protein